MTRRCLHNKQCSSRSWDIGSTIYKPGSYIVSKEEESNSFCQLSEQELSVTGLTHSQDGKKNEAAAFIALLRACAKSKDLCKGAGVHNEILRQGSQEKCFDALVTMYAKCGALVKAKELFQTGKSRDLLTWTALIAAYTQKGRGENALDCFERMQLEGLSPDVVILSYIIKACGSIGAVDRGRNIHEVAAKQGLLRNNIILGTALVDMYARWGALKEAQQVLEELPVRNVISWTAIIAGYVQQGHGAQALICFEHMQQEGLSPDAVTFISILKACGIIGAADRGENIHNEIAKQGLLAKDIMLGTALVDMYAKCGALAKARQVLLELPIRDVISWSALIAGYIKQGEGEQALSCFEQMQREGHFPNAVTLLYIIKACGNIGAVDKGEKVHDQIARQGLLAADVLLGNALVDMYSKCGALDKARKVLNELCLRNVVSWNALIAGYAQEGQGEQALSCLEGMQSEGLLPDEVTFICILKACGSLGAADKGKRFHDEIAKEGLLENGIALGNALVDMYAKCGALTKAREVLEELPLRDVISWNALIAGYAQQCEGAQALSCLMRLQREGLYPDLATYVSVLSACSGLGLIEDASRIFMHMITNHQLIPELEHYTCMVDLFGCAGLLDKAVGVIERMPPSDGGVWSALMGACQKWGDVRVGKWAFEHAQQLDRFDAASYVLMANIYAIAGMQHHNLHTHEIIFI